MDAMSHANGSEVDRLAGNRDALTTDAPAEVPAHNPGDVPTPERLHEPPQLEPVTDSEAPAEAVPERRKRSLRPSFARQRTLSRRTHRSQWSVAVAGALAMMLALQLVIADRASLAADPRWRPSMLRFCQLVRCDIPAWRDASAFTMLDRDVRAHPTAANTLRVQVAFRNDAHWAQPWPELVLTLSDATGRVTGSRSFNAVEYLRDAPSQKLIAAGQTASFVLDVSEPAPNTVSFSFDFR